MKISIVIPVYNSFEGLKELNRQVQDALQGINFELILVNDYSSDNSWQIINELATEFDNVIGINLRRNFGQDSAIMAGLKSVSGKYIVIMDDDLQHSPYDILPLYNKCKEGFDICYADFETKKHAAWKNWGSSLNGLLANMFLNKPKHIYMSPFKVINREVIDEIHYLGSTPYVDGLLLELTHNVTMEKVSHHKRFAGRSNYNLIKSIAVFLRLMINFSVTPLRFATIIGFILALVGFFVGLYFMVLFFMDNVIEGWTSLIVSQLFVGGILLICMGLIGEYLGRMYLSVNHKPQYSIGKIVRKEKE